ncbi:peptidase M23-like protein [Balneicella halophila]|uniref:Peptidase M23-like protein n=1 Tax=Balneicella halophila TaxID=1537566 RepID=A0A7L4UQ87_BALHA|nr:M23 family metallopeptidase [Balneicella halophila]PVX51948.1 peptidase M23-like protein [Balneicella halophila]
MKYALLIILIFNISFCEAQTKLKVYYKKTSIGYRIYADNNEFCPVSTKFDFSLTNLFVKDGKKQAFVIEPLAKEQLLTSLNIIDKHKAYGFTYNFTSYLGDYRVDEVDEKYNYSLPYKTGQEFRINQGYLGTSTHKNVNALDFSLPFGTEVVAIRDGIVVRVIENHQRGCPTKDCASYTNYITIYHSDGTFAEYAHLKHDGSLVKEGDKVLKDQLIGFSGNTGWCSGPHLHIEVYKRNFKVKKSLQTKFRIGNGGQTVGYLKEGETYLKDY